MWDEEYYRGHECRRYAPTWVYASEKGDSSPETDGCFLSSACVEYLNLPDDCRELTTLRSFRDQVLMASPEGKSIVRQYYEIAPSLVEKINLSENKDTIYRGIYQRILLCIREIEGNATEEAIKQYKNMVEYVTGMVC